MTHDPLCPSYGLCDCGCEYDAHCMCGFIAKVRADELRRPSEDGWMSVRAVLAWEDQVRADERAKCIDVLDAHHPRCTEPCDLCAEWSALREGLEALAGNP